MVQDMELLSVISFVGETFKTSCCFKKIQIWA